MFWQRRLLRRRSLNGGRSFRPAGISSPQRLFPTPFTHSRCSLIDCPHPTYFAKRVGSPRRAFVLTRPHHLLSDSEGLAILKSSTYVGRANAVLYARSAAPNSPPPRILAQARPCGNFAPNTHPTTGANKVRYATGYWSSHLPTSRQTSIGR